MEEVSLSFCIESLTSGGGSIEKKLLSSAPQLKL